MKAETGKLETALWIEALLSGGGWLLWVSEGESQGMQWRWRGVKASC